MAPEAKRRKQQHRDLEEDGLCSEHTFQMTGGLHKVKMGFQNDIKKKR